MAVLLATARKSASLADGNFGVFFTSAAGIRRLLYQNRSHLDCSAMAEWYRERMTGGTVTLENSRGDASECLGRRNWRPL